MNWITTNHADVAAVEAAAKDDSYVILDARKAADYKDAHVAGAVSAEWMDTSTQITRQQQQLT